MKAAVAAISANVLILDLLALHSGGLRTPSTLGPSTTFLAGLVTSLRMTLLCCYYYVLQ